MRNSGDFDDAGAGALDFVKEVGGGEFVFGEGFDVGDGFAGEGFADEFDFVAFDVFDGEDVEFGEEVEGEVVDGVAEDGFLDEEDVAFGFFDLFDHVQEICSFFFEDFVHLPVVVDHYLILHVWLRWTKLELYEAYSGFLHSGWTTSAFYDWLIQDKSINHFAVFYRSPYFFDYSDVLQIDIVSGFLIDCLQDRVDCHRTKKVRVLRDNFRG